MTVKMTQLFFRSKWLNVESIWLSMLSQLDSHCWVNLTLNVEPIWLSMLSQLDSHCWVSLTLNVELIRLSVESIRLNVESIGLNVESIGLNDESIWLLMLSQFDSNIFQLPTLPGRILVPQVTQLFMLKLLIFFSICIIACRHIYSELDDAAPQASNQWIKISALVCRHQIY